MVAMIKVLMIARLNYEALEFLIKLLGYQHVNVSKWE